MSELDSSKLASLFDFPHGDLVIKSLIASRDRIRDAYAEIFSGYGINAEAVLNETVRVKNYTGIIEMKDVHFYTVCEHHFLPFFGTADISYEPNEIITGIGKLVRLVRDVHARRLQIQEIMTRDIAEDVMRVLNAKGVRVVTKARHLCICSRGPADDGAFTEVSYEVGSLNRHA